MLVHVVVKSQVNNKDGFLTYHSSSSLAVGQLVMVPLRGRIVPGFVVGVNVGASFKAQIKSVSKSSSYLLPQNFVNYFLAVANMYLISPSNLLQIVWPDFNSKYINLTLEPKLASTSPTAPESTLYFTPNTNKLDQTKIPFVTYPEEAGNAQSLFAQCLRRGVRVAGTQKIAWLPYAKISQIIFDSPFLNPYESQRAPNLHSFVLAQLLTKHYGCQMTVRTLIPQALLFSETSKNITVSQPKIKTIKTLVAPDKFWLNKNMLAEINELLQNKQRVGIYFNSKTRLEADTGKIKGLRSLANQLAKACPVPVGVISNDEETLTDAPLIVFTNKALYQPLQIDWVVVLSADALLSTNRLNSHLEALDILGVLVARHNLLFQDSDINNPLLKACRVNFAPLAMNEIKWPTFGKRIIRLIAKKPNLRKELGQLKELGINYNLKKETQKTILTFITTPQIEPTIDQFIKNNRATFKIIPFAHSLELE